MVELRDDPFYGELARCGGCVVDYCLLKNGAPYRGEASHREALAFAMRRLSLPDGETEPLWAYDAGRASAKRTDAKAFLSLPSAPRTETVLRKDGTSAAIPYRRAFLEPPHGTDCTEADFERLNRALFPNGTDALTVYEWTTDWSDYFDEGHEWWGAGCWSVYDASLDRFAVVMASATD